MAKQLSCIAPAKRGSILRDDSKIAVLILAAGPGKKMRSYGPRSLLDINGETLLTKQINTIRKVYPNSEFFCVVGFDYLRVVKKHPNIKYIVNPNYDTTTVVTSILYGLINILHHRIMIVYGDICFNEFSVNNLSQESSILVDNANQIIPEDIGVVYENNKITNFSYGITNKWGQICFLQNNELDLMRQTILSKENIKLNTFEIFNEMIDRGANLRPVINDKSRLIEIDNYKNVEEACKI